MRQLAFAAAWIYPAFWLASLIVYGLGSWDTVSLSAWGVQSWRGPSWWIAAAVLASALAISRRWPAAGSLALAAAAISLLPRVAMIAWFVDRRRAVFASAAAALTAVLIFAALRLRRAATPRSTVALAGAALTLLLSTGSHLAGQEMRRQRDEARRADRERIMATLPKPDPKQPYPKLFFQRGANFTAEGPVGYSPGPSTTMLDQLKSAGVNSIALVPYGFSQGANSPEVRGGRGGTMERDDDMEAITALAHQRGIRVMLKPQVWLGRGGYPGAVVMLTDADRSAWFASYTEWIEHYARLAAKIHADLFCVGVEFRQMARHDGEWRRIIARVRAIYPGPLTYGATQGEEFESITFWDALDYIGLNNYYPLPDSLDFSAIVKKVEDVHLHYKRPVIFPEAGYSSVENPHREPWAEHHAKLSMDAQARCVDAMLKAFYKKPWFMGVYWWKIGTNGFGGPEDGSHTPWRKPAMDVISRWYKTGAR